MSKVLTVSVAAYHVEQYLRECLDSFLIPEAENDVEVLIINDGSGEGINVIGKEYEKKYPQIFRLIDKENGGHGSTVNRGIREASGKYFKTVDGDDWVRRDGFRDLVNYLKTEEVDLLVTDFQSFDDASGNILKEIRYEFPNKKYQYIYKFEEVCDKVYVNMHAATFQTSLLRQMGRTLDEKCFYVDAEYILYPVPLVKTIAFLEKPVYMYRLGLEQQSMNIKNMQKNCGHHEKVLQSLLAFYKECCQELSEEKRRYIAGGIARILTSQYKIYLSFETGSMYKEKIREMDLRIKENYPEVYHEVANPAVKILRLSKYCTYLLLSAVCRRKYHCKKGDKE